jgi:hypothetical protein
VGNHIRDIVSDHPFTIRIMGEETLGEKINEVLEELELVLLEHELLFDTKPDYSIDAIRAIIRLFMSAMVDKSYELTKGEGIELEDQINMVNTMAKDLHNFIKKYTDIDTHKLYEEL